MGDAMTESEWQECTTPTLMLEFLHGKASERKSRLCASAWARLLMKRAVVVAVAAHRDWLTDPAWLTQFDAAEEYADGVIGTKTARAARTLKTGGPYNVFWTASRIKGFSLDQAYHSLYA